MVEYYQLNKSPGDETVRPGTFVVAGIWLARAETVQGKSAKQIQDLLNLPRLPTMIVDVHLPTNTLIRRSQVGSNFFGDAEGAFQYQLLDAVPDEAFKNARPIGLRAK